MYTCLCSICRGFVFGFGGFDFFVNFHAAICGCNGVCPYDDFRVIA